MSKARIWRNSFFFPKENILKWLFIADTCKNYSMNTLHIQHSSSRKHATNKWALWESCKNISIYRSNISDFRIYRIYVAAALPRSLCSALQWWWYQDKYSYVHKLANIHSWLIFRVTDHSTLRRKEGSDWKPLLASTTYYSVLLHILRNLCKAVFATFSVHPSLFARKDPNSQNPATEKKNKSLSDAA